MAEGQTRLTQVADKSSWDVARPVSASVEDFWPRRVLAEDPGSDRHRAQIQRVVEHDVLPRVSAGQAPAAVVDPVDATAVGNLVDLLLRPKHEAAVAQFVDAALAQGLPVEHAYLRLFQPAARRLGDLWAEDLCSFVDVTLAIGTLQALLRRLAPMLPRHGRPADDTRTILLTTLPGDQHTFGVNMAAEFFRRSGWHVGTSRWRDAAADLAREIRSGAYGLVGFSVSGDRHLDRLASTIACLRKVCGADRVAVLVGGPVFMMDPGLANRVGADAVGLDAKHAVAQAEALACRNERR